jgi:hypothetical protein
MRVPAAPAIASMPSPTTPRPPQTASSPQPKVISRIFIEENLLRNPLECHRAIKRLVLGQVDLSHTALPDQALNAVLVRDQVTLPPAGNSIFCQVRGMSIVCSRAALGHRIGIEVNIRVRQASSLDGRIYLDGLAGWPAGGRRGVPISRGSIDFAAFGP